MNWTMRIVLAAVLSVTGALATGAAARADVSNSTANNLEDGSNRSTGNQRGSSASGDAVGGQVTGVVSSGRTSVDARNTSSNSDVTSGDARGGNSASTFTGLNTSDSSTRIGAADVINSCNTGSCPNVQDGDNRSTYTQTATYTTGDGVAGQVIGAVTSSGGSASIVAANTSTDVSVTTGDARGTNDFAAFTGHNLSASLSVLADVTGSCNSTNAQGACANVQNGSNRTTARQASTATTGDGVAGQVIGAVSAGATSIDATNTSNGVDITTGDATSSNSAAAFVGEKTTPLTTLIRDVTNSCNAAGCVQVQDGSDTATLNQSSSATTGDGVGGQVIGAVTSAGGSASIVAANTSTNSDVTTGDAHSTNDLNAFVGLSVSPQGGTVIADVTNSCANQCGNVQNGNNRLTGSQTATSSTGDSVAGQVLGVVSAGAASLDATNRSDDSSVTTGDSHADNAASQFVGLNFSLTTNVGGGGVADVTGARAINLQDGSNRRTLSQAAVATSGDGVAGQVSGVVTSAGGSASVVLANSSTSIDSTSGDTRFDNSDAGFVGMNDGSGPLSIV